MSDRNSEVSQYMKRMLPAGHISALVSNPDPPSFNDFSELFLGNNYLNNINKLFVKGIAVNMD